MNDSSHTDYRFLRRWFSLAVLAAVFLAVGLILQPLVMPIIWAAFLAFLLQPLQVRLTRRFKRRGSAAAGVITALTPIAILAPIALLGLAFAHEIQLILAKLQDNPAIWDLQTWQDPSKYPRIAQLWTMAQERFSISAADVQGWLVTGTQTGLKSLAGFSGAFVLGAAGTVLRFFLMLFILFFMLRDGAAWFRRAILLVPMQPSRRAALFDRLARVTRAVVFGAGLTAMAQGLLVGIGIAIAGLPSPVVLGVLAGLSALLPFGGAAIVWVPAAVYLFATHSYGMGIFMLVWGAIVSISDNFIRPVIISAQTPVPTLLVFLGVIGGVAAFGPIGFIVGPVLLVLATELFRFAEATLNPDED
ncbi:MAG: AI-2E family transporter [Steroidobacteraceae bacterium]